MDIPDDARWRLCLLSIAHHLGALAADLEEYARGVPQPQEPIPPEPEPEMIPRYNERRAKLEMDIGELELSVRSDNALRKAGVNTIGELVAMTPEAFYNTRNLGARSRNEVNDVLARLGYERKRLSPNLS